MSFRGERAREESSLSPRLILITGGARAGKSRFAQTLAEQGSHKRRLFLATAVACDPEMKTRIAAHRRSRNGLWKTLEEPVALPKRIPSTFLQKGSLLLLDCLPTLTTNLMLAGHSEKRIETRMKALFKACRRPGVTTLVVSNEVGFGIVPDNPLARQFRDLLGKVNQQAASAADEVYLLVAGIPVKVK